MTCKSKIYSRVVSLIILYPNVFLHIQKSGIMGTMFRSEEMVLCQLFVQSEAAYVSMYELGEAGVAQFRDVSTHTSTLAYL